MSVRRSVYKEGVAFENSLRLVLSEDYEVRDATLSEQLSGIDFYAENRPFQVKYDIKAKNRLAIEYNTLMYCESYYYLWGVPYLKTVFVFRTHHFNQCFQKWLGFANIGAKNYLKTVITSPTNPNTKVDLICVPIDDVLKDYMEMSGAKPDSPPPTLLDRFEISWADIMAYMPENIVQ